MMEFEQNLRKGIPLILDVREDYEFQDGHIKGARNVPLQTLPTVLAELDKGQEYHVICLSGSRSAVACKYLAQEGFQVVNVMGGMSAYRGDVEFGC